MARKHRVQQPSLASLILLAGAASGTLLTLSNFQSLTASVSVQCLYAYNLPIRGCSPSDFTHGKTCSESCIAGLLAVQFTVQGVCSNVNTASNSLLVKVKEGHILDALCKAEAPETSSTPTPTPPPKQTLPPPPPPPPPPSSPSPPPPPPPPPPPQQPSSEPEHTSTTSDPISTTSSVPSQTATTAISTLTSVALPSSTSEPTTETTTTPTSQATIDEQPSSTSEEKPKPTRKPNTQPGSGGGSPFDFVASSKATTLGSFRGSITSTMAIAIAFTTLTLI
ncbi:hypothetical protein V8C35DRAFT_298156 [Trichoderma chlorosporum]